MIGTALGTYRVTEKVGAGSMGDVYRAIDTALNRAVARRTKAMTMLTHFPSASGYVRYPVWSPRSRRLVFERSLRTSTVWTADTK